MQARERDLLAAHHGPLASDPWAAVAAEVAAAEAEAAAKAAPHADRHAGARVDRAPGHRRRRGLRWPR